MYFAHDLFVKKGPLSTMWIAGNGFIRKMTKQTILNTQIEKLVESLQDPPVPLALRAISTLVLGIARIYDKKASYIYLEALDIIARARAQERPTANVDLKAPSTRAVDAMINVPERAPEFDVFNFDQELKTELEEVERGLPIALPALARPEVARRAEEQLSETASFASMVESADIGLGSPGFKAMLARELEEPTVRYEAPEIEMPVMDYPDFDVDIGGIDIQAPKPSEGSEGLRTPPPRLSIVHEHPELEAEAAEMPPAEEAELEAEEAGVPLAPRAPRRKYVAVDEKTELDDQTIRNNLVDTSNTWSEYRRRATMNSLLGRAGWAQPLFRLGSAEDNAHWMRLPSFLNKEHASPQLLELFRRDMRGIDTVAAKKRRVARAERPAAAAAAAAEEKVEAAQPAAEEIEQVGGRGQPVVTGLARAGAAAAAVIAAEEMGGVELPSMAGSISPSVGAAPAPFEPDFDIDIGGAHMPPHEDEAAGPEEDRFREIEQARGGIPEDARSVSSDRGSFLGERLDIGFSPGPAEPRMSIGAEIGAARAATAAAMGGGPPASTSSRRSRASMLQSSAERDQARRSLGLAPEELPSPDLGVTVSQFELPEITVESEQPIEKNVRYNVSRATQIFRDRLIQKSDLAGDEDAEVSFNQFVAENTAGPVTRRDACLGLLQVLVLKTLDVVKVEQIEPFADIILTRGRGWDVPFAESA